MKKINLMTLSLLAGIAMGVIVSMYYSTKPQVHSQATRKIKYWVAPMNPNYRRDKPGKSPMGMDLVPVYADAGASNVDAVKISPTVVNNLGVKVSRVKKGTIAKVIDTVGYVSVAEDNIEHIHSYVDGWIKRLYVKKTGEMVRKGQLLLEIYSPQLNSAQEELLLAIKNNNLRLINAGEKKLVTLGMSKQQIRQLKKTQQVFTNVKLFASKSGVVSQLNVREGKFVKPAVDIMSIEDLSQIWVIADVFERQADWVAKGQRALATLPYKNNKTWQGSVDYVYPSLDAKTHTLKVRLVFPNLDLSMRPNMYANIKIYSQEQSNVLLVPSSAVIRTGTMTRVIVAMGDGQFVPRLVSTGVEAQDTVEIKTGLNEGESVVVSSHFLLDSETNISAGLSRMAAVKPRKETSHQPMEYIAMGIVKHADVATRKITITHKPIPALKMPKMTMTLPVADSVSFEGVGAGTHIHFKLIRTADGNYQVTALHVINSQLK